jgi:hypothetical protein
MYTMFNIAQLKAGMKDAGYAVSEGVTMAHKDVSNYLEYAYRFFGLSNAAAAYELAYPTKLSAAIPGSPSNNPGVLVNPPPTDTDPDEPDELKAPVEDAVEDSSNQEVGSHGDQQSEQSGEQEQQ